VTPNPEAVEAAETVIRETIRKMGYHPEYPDTFELATDVLTAATPFIHEQMLDRMVARVRARFEQGERFDLDLLVEFIRAQKEATS
jgi:hypothetical protein